MQASRILSRLEPCWTRMVTPSPMETTRAGDPPVEAGRGTGAHQKRGGHARQRYQPRPAHRVSVGVVTEEGHPARQGSDHPIRARPT